jgi:hypothetical protein
MSLGRPKLPPADRRDQQVTVQVSSVELNAIDKKAAAGGQSRSQLGRSLFLRHKMPVPVVDKDAYAALQKIGGNLNQLMRAINQGFAVDPARVVETLDGLNRVVKRILG